MHRMYDPGNAARAGTGCPGRQPCAQCCTCRFPGPGCGSHASATPIAGLNGNGGQWRHRGGPGMARLGKN